VVVTSNFNDETWLTDDGAFHSPKLKVTERIRRAAADALEWTAVVEDTEVLAQPWSLRPRRMTVSATEMAEPAPCVEQDMAHMVDDTYHSNPR
jgi:hypothetical protein